VAGLRFFGIQERLALWARVIEWMSRALWHKSLDDRIEHWN